MKRACVIGVFVLACRGDATPPPREAPAPVTPVVAVAPQSPAHGHDWDDIYRAGVGFDQQPNAWLVRNVTDLAPGRALDIGMGQGRNAVFLATRGWDVTGVDTSREGVRIADEQARAAAVQLHGVVQDVDTFDLGVEQWDLITMIYMEDRTLADRIVKALKPGGRVVIEYFHADSNDYFPHPIRGFATGELERMFHGLEVVDSVVVDDVADFGERPAKLVRFVARKPLRAHAG